MAQVYHLARAASAALLSAQVRAKIHFTRISHFGEPRGFS